MIFMTDSNLSPRDTGLLITRCIDYRESNLALVDILVNGEKVDALSQIVNRDSARLARPARLRKIERGDSPPDV